MNLKESYWKYSLITIILVMGIILFLEFIPFLGGILGAFTIYILLRKQMLHLTEKKHLNRSLVAILLLLETILCFLIPLSLAVWLFINKLQTINLDPTVLVSSFEHLADIVRQKVGYNILDKDNIACSSQDRTGIDGRYQWFCHQCGRAGTDPLLYADRGKPDGNVYL